MSRQFSILLIALSLTLSSFVAPAQETKSVGTIITYIDSLYEIKSPARTDSISVFSKLNRDKYYGLLKYAKKDIRKYYSHLTFNFYIFKDYQSALRQFNELISLSQTSLSILSDDTLISIKYDHLFLKQGCTYILYDNIIVQHLRRCNYKEKIEKPRETKLSVFLFNNNFPTNKYFLRVACSWDRPEIK